MDRKIKLLNIINEEKKISVVDLAEKLCVSQVTIRKDLDELEKRGLLEREHGFAVALNNDDLSNRLAHNYSIKSRIAKAAASDILDGEVLMIESGSTCSLFAEQICKQRNSAKIITNSVFISNFIREYTNVNVTILGGEYQKQSQVNIGPLTSICASQYKVDKLFIGADGFDENYGLTGLNMMRVDTVQKMSESAKKIIVLCDSEKFGRISIVKLFPFERIHCIYTDKGLNEEVKKQLENNGIIVKIVA